MPTQQADILVLGAGVVGLTVATLLAEAGAQVAVVADTVPGRTSFAAGAQWGPYLVEPKSRVRAWALESLARFTELAADAEFTGVRMTPGIEASRTFSDPPDFTDMFPNVAVMDAAHLPPGFVSGVRYTVPTIDMPQYLGHLRERLNRTGTSIQPRHIANLDEAASLAPVVVNCTGIGARSVTPDETVHPIRGQLVVVENPGLSEWFSEDTGTSEQLTHWCPHGATVVLGGQASPGASDMTPDPDVARQIHARCAAIEPRLLDARVIEHRVGLRPTRPAVRLEPEQRAKTLIVHCYGHGGAGVTLSWGCAEEVCSLLMN